MFIIKYKAVFFTFSALLVLASLFSLYQYGLNFGTDFKGGTIMELHYATVRPEATVIKETLAPFNLGSVSVQPAGTNDVIIRFGTVNEDTHSIILKSLIGNDQGVTETRYSSIGPSLGKELARKGLIALGVAVLFIIIYIAIAFRSVSRPVSSWKYGLIAIAALVHDVIIPTGVFSILGHFYGVEIDSLFLTALLTIFGLSISDTIVVFDRVRENLKKHKTEPFAETVGRSLEETYVRSFNTSFTVILALLALLLFGSQSTRYFALALTIGMIVGTYSSIFIASPLLVTWEKLSRKK
jgi:preprotein translocase subunit SecF